MSLILFLLVLSATGHEKSLSLSRNQAHPGDLLEVRGAGLGAHATIKLTLRGVLNTYPLGEAQGNAHGEFRVELVIPAEVKPGNYTIQARVGTTAASAPLKVAPLKKGLSHQAPDPESRVEEHASADPLSLDHSRNPSETVTVWGLIVLAVLAAGLLWFRG